MTLSSGNALVLMGFSFFLQYLLEIMYVASKSQNSVVIHYINSPIVEDILLSGSALLGLCIVFRLSQWQFKGSGSFSAVHISDRTTIFLMGSSWA